MGRYSVTYQYTFTPLVVTLHIKHFIQSFQSVQPFTDQVTDPLLVIAVSIIFHLLSNCLPQFSCTVHYISNNVIQFIFTYAVKKSRVRTNHSCEQT